MTTVDLVTVRLTWAEGPVLRPAPHLLRGAIAHRFPDESLVHQHDGDSVLYRYPRIQYRWDESGPMLLGLGEGAKLLTGIDWVGMELDLGGRVARVGEAVCAFRRHEIRPAGRLRRYVFAAPWLPLSQANHARFQEMTRATRRLELDRLAVAGTLLGLRGFGVDFPGRLLAGFEMSGCRPCRYKGITFQGFTGQLLANVDLPDGFALGRAISHGYGWIVSAESEVKDDATRGD